MTMISRQAERLSIRLLIYMGALISLPLMAENSKPLIINIKGTTANTGQVFVSVFSSEENYLKTPVSRKQQPIKNSNQVQLIFNNLEAGVYSISVIYDEDGDGELNTNFLGIPTELVGFSNNTKGLFGPPSFKKTSFHFPEINEIEIHLGKAKE